jgi:isopenicillin N synthase-like dioxygenase
MEQPAVPIVDISAYLSASEAPETKRDVIQRVVHSFATLGFLYILGHGLSSELLDQIAEQNKVFSLLSADEKEQLVSKDRARRGYSHSLSENFASLAGEKRPNDLVEKLRFGPELFPLKEQEGQGQTQGQEESYYQSNECKVHFSPNEWGPLPSSFRDLILEYSEAMRHLSHTIVEMLAIGLSQPSDYFTSSMDKPTSILTLNYFPPLSSEATTVRDEADTSTSPPPSSPLLRVAEHTDVSLITIVNQTQPPSCSSSLSTSSDGLEICQPDGQWIPIPNVPGALVINIGDCLQFWSGGQLRSTRHRVTLPSPRPDGEEGPLYPERYSIAYFVSPNYDAVLHRVKETEATTSDPLTYSQWRKERIKQAMKALKQQR